MGDLNMSRDGLRVRVPKDRLGVVIGPEGRTKSAIERKLLVKLDVDSETGDIQVISELEGNPADVFRARDIVTAIGRGFSPENAFRLIDDEAILIVIDLREFFGRSDSDIERVKGRIIGEHGKTRRNIEEMTGTKISLYGHTVTLIGEVEHCDVAREAVEMFIKGRTHSSVYKFLQAKRGDLKEKEMDIWRTSPEGKG
jgi:ribosomal RNA assembly protein